MFNTLDVNKTDLTGISLIKNLWHGVYMGDADFDVVVTKEIFPTTLKWNLLSTISDASVMEGDHWDTADTCLTGIEGYLPRQR